MRRVTGLLAMGAAIVLLAPAGAAAKEISAAKICGAARCTEVLEPELATVLAAGGPPMSGPGRALPWYRTTLTVSAGDGFVDRFTVSAVPSARLLRGEDGAWMTLPPRATRAYARLTAAIRPRPARTLPDVGPDAKPVEARVDEVFEPAAVVADESAGAPAWPWIAGALLTAAGLALLLAGRRRRAAAAPGGWSLRFPVPGRVVRRERR